MSDSSETFSGLWGPLYGVLRHLKVHSVQHDILWPVRASLWCVATFKGSLGTARHSLASGLYVALRNLNFTTLLTYLFHKQKISCKRFYIVTFQLDLNPAVGSWYTTDDKLTTFRCLVEVVGATCLNLRLRRVILTRQTKRVSHYSHLLRNTFIIQIHLVQKKT